jgi:hypothetical protein
MMKIKIDRKMFFILTIALLTACGNPERQNGRTSLDTLATAISENKNYVIENAEKKETTGKAQVKVAAYLKQDFKDEAELNHILENIYALYRHQGGYSHFDEPTVVAVYLFETEKMAKSDPSAWIGMLMKGPNDISPRLSLNNFKVTAALGLKDTVLSEDEIELSKINKVLRSRNVELCDLNIAINAIELNSIHAADRLYPDYGLEHDDYAGRLMAIELKKLKKKYRLTTGNLDMISTLALIYCK